MAYTEEHKDDNKTEIQLIIDTYSSGVSLSDIAKTFKLGKTTIKKLLISNSIEISRNVSGICFSDNEIEDIRELYNKGFGLQKIADQYNVSKTPIKRLIKDSGQLRSQASSKKIVLSEEQKDEIKTLYLSRRLNTHEISNKLGLTQAFINKYLGKVDYRRTKSEALSIIKLGVELSDLTKRNMTIAQQKIANSGFRKQTGGVCKTFDVGGITCVGTYEKFYVEELILNNRELPITNQSINTPYGVYYPDFTYNDKHVEIKSDYTYDVLIGIKPSRWTGEIETKQYDKIKWVNYNIHPVEIIVVDKKNNKFNIKQIE